MHRSNKIGKISKTFDNNTISSCMFYMNFLSLNYEYIRRKVSLFYENENGQNISLVTLFSKFGSNDLIKCVVIWMSVMVQQRQS